MEGRNVTLERGRHSNVHDSSQLTYDSSTIVSSTIEIPDRELVEEADDNVSLDPEQQDQQSVQPASDVHGQQGPGIIPQNQPVPAAAAQNYGLNPVPQCQQVPSLVSQNQMLTPAVVQTVVTPRVGGTF